MFFSEEKLESYSYVLISFIFDYYLVSHSAYIFLYFFLSNSQVVWQFVGKRLMVYFISDNGNIIRMYLATHT